MATKKSKSKEEQKIPFMEQDVPTTFEPGPTGPAEPTAQVEPVEPAAEPEVVSEDSAPDYSVLRRQVAVVIEARKAKFEIDERIKMLRLTWETQFKAVLDQQAARRAELEDREARLREHTIDAYKMAGDKHPLPGVGIREITILGYDPKTALSWATEHKIALALDKKAFEGIAKQSPLDFVTSTTEIQATISSELTAPEA